MKKASGLWKDISQSAMANVLSMLLGMLAVTLIPKCIGVERYGYYQLYVLLTTYAVFFELGLSDGNYLNSSGILYGQLDHQRQADQFWLLTLTQWLLSTIIWMVGILCIGRGPVGEAFTWAVICSLFIHARYFLYLLMQGTGRVRNYARVIIIERVLSVGLSVALIMTGYRGYRLLIFFDVLGRAVSLGYAAACSREIVLRRPRWGSTAMADARRNISAGIALTTVAQAGTVIIGMSRLLVQAKWDIATFAQVSLSINILNLLVRCANAIAIGIFPYSIQMDREQQEALYHRSSRSFTLLVGVALLAYAPGVRLLEWWFPEYGEGMAFLVYIVPMGIYECRNALIANVYMKALRKDRQMLIINGLVIIFGVVTAAVSVFVCGSLAMLLLSISAAMALRCLAASVCVEREWKDNRGERWVKIAEAALIVAFVVACSV